MPCSLCDMGARPLKPGDSCPLCKRRKPEYDELEQALKKIAKAKSLSTCHVLANRTLRGEEK